MLIDRIDMKKRKEKLRVKAWREDVNEALKRVNKCFGASLGEADRTTLAGVFATERNALHLCEEGKVGEAISLLKEQEGQMIPVAIMILERVKAAK